MSMEGALVASLKVDAGLSALVSTRVYQLILPQNPTLPAVRVQLVDDFATYHLAGATGLRYARVQCDAFTDVQATNPYAGAASIVEAIDAALVALATSDIGGSPATHGLRGVMHVDSRTAFEAGSLRMVRASRDYRVQFIEL